VKQTIATISLFIKSAFDEVSLISFSFAEKDNA
jgi:hypothetical protein